MNRIFNLRNLLCVTLTAAASGAFATSGTQACDLTVCRYSAPCCLYVKVICDRYVRRSEHRWVTYTDHCGCKRRYRVTIYRTVKVPYSRWVNVCRADSPSAK